MDTNSVIERLKKYCNENPEIVKNSYIKGINPSNSMIAIEVNGEKKNISIDELESNSWLNPKVEEEVIEVMDDVSNDTIAMNTGVIQTIQNPNNIIMENPIPSPNVNQTINNQQVTTINPTSKNIITLKDMKEAIIAKDEDSVNKALEKFAIDEKTGSVNINKAIKIVTDNSTNNVINSIKNNTLLSSNLEDYDIKGNLTKQPLSTPQKVELQSLIDTSFNNILVYVEAARLRNVVYNESQIQVAKTKYATGINDKLNVLGLNKKEEEITPDNKKEVVNNMSLELQPDKNIKKAGFADILILTIIILVYAAIIINLITKLK